jgi:ATP-dependent Lhr-like helicase
VTPFDRLHPALQHHIVNSLGWRTLRPLQEAAIEPLLAGAHALVIGPTAGGKTEAVVFPLLSRMLSEGWLGLSILYVCPIKALLNNLEPRLATYGGLVGRRVERWHGDIGDSMRRRIRQDPPDLLLTTPESIEVMLVSRRSDRRALFGRARAVVVDELHAFAGDDRGWHLLAVLERVARIAGGELQRVGLSATIGNPDELLTWLAGACAGARHVVGEPAGVHIDSEPPSPAPPDIGLDYVGSLGNAATVISRLHRGEKRLVFLDSRAGVERLASDLRSKGVSTFVSHSSLGLDERRRAETAFAEGGDCVIVATSTLELGIDVGDLDRVIQVDAPPTVSAFLQRLGRTGRRAGTRRNCLFLATSDEAFLRAAGLVKLFADGYVEPVTPPPEPAHVLAQQILALALQQGGIGRSAWRDWVGRVPAFRAMPERDVDEVLHHMVGRGLLFEEAGILSIGAEGERSFGYRNFIELFSVFNSPPLFTVLHGRAELGRVHEVSFHTPGGDAPILLLAGQSWAVTHIDWRRRIAYVEPGADGGRSRWLGEGQALHFRLCRAIHAVLAGSDVRAELSRRAVERLNRLRAGFAWVDEGRTALVTDGSGRTRWWTFAGLRANTALASWLGSLADARGSWENFAVPLAADGTASGLRSRLAEASPEEIVARMPVSAAAMDGLKFSACLPERMARQVLRARLADLEAVRWCAATPIVTVSPDVG